MSERSATDPNGSDERPLRILYIADTFPPNVNGAATFGAELAAGMAGRGHDVRVVAPGTERGRGRVQHEKHRGHSLTMYRLRSWPWPRHWLRFALPWRTQANARRILDEFQPDIVHFQSHLVTGRGFARQASKRGIPVYGTNHFMPENLLDHTGLPRAVRGIAVRLAWRDAATTYRLAQSVTAPTRKAAAFLERETGIEGVHAVSCGIHTQTYAAEIGPRRENRIVFVGRVTSEKNIDVLVRAAAKLDAALDVRVEIVGGGDQIAALRRLATELGVGDRVAFTGFVTDQQLRAAYTRASVFAMPSTAELQSIATMEAMASGLPVVAADAMALPHLVHDGDNGYLFAPGDADAMADRLTRVLTAPSEEYERLQRNSLAIVAPHDIEATYDAFEALYRGRPLPEREARLQAPDEQN